MFLANLITMTPGTLRLDICKEKQRLQIHSMYVDDTKAAVQELETKIVRRIRDVF